MRAHIYILNVGDGKIRSWGMTSFPEYDSHLSCVCVQLE